MVSVASTLGALAAFTVSRTAARPWVEQQLAREMRVVLHCPHRRTLLILATPRTRRMWLGSSQPLLLH